jgi:hypothetical protein
VTKKKKPARSGPCAQPKKKESMSKKQTYTIVRTTSAGVHVGVVTSRKGTEVVLTDARRIWRWNGANSLSEMSIRGVSDDYSRISEPVTEITLTQAIELIPCSKEAQANLTRSRWGA